MSPQNLSFCFIDMSSAADVSSAVDVSSACNVMCIDPLRSSLAALFPARWWWCCRWMLIAPDAEGTTRPFLGILAELRASAARHLSCERCVRRLRPTRARHNFDCSGREYLTRSALSVTSSKYKI
jgi:hypothetical protein